MSAPVVIITWDMPVAKRRRLTEEGLAAGAIVVFHPKPDPEDDDDWEYGVGGDPTYHDRYRSDQDERGYREQIDRWSVTCPEYLR